MPPEVFQNHQRNNAPESSEHPSILFNGWWPKKTVKTLVAHTRAIGGPGIFLRSRAPFPPPHTSLSHASSRKLTHARTKKFEENVNVTFLSLVSSDKS
jgi:hypothetical protein